MNDAHGNGHDGTGHLIMLGCGRMGSALLSQWLSSGSWRGPVTIVKPNPVLPEAIRAYRAVQHAPSLSALPKGPAPALVVLAVKPQMMGEILADCAAHLARAPEAPAPLYLTIAAGLRLSNYMAHLGEAVRLIRLMPNTPTQIGMGMTTLLASSQATEEDHELAEQLMRAVGEITWFDSEDKMDAATAISGSGPAYVYYFMECLISAAIEAGLDEKTARLLVVQTVQGASELAYLSGEPLARLRHDVTSPGGTTEAALSRLMHPSGMLRLTHEAVQAALEKSRELVAAAQ